MTFFINTLLSPNTIHRYDTCINKWLLLVPLQSVDFIILFPKQSIALLIRHLLHREQTEQKLICTHTNIRHYLAAILAVLRYSPHVAPTIPNRMEYYQLWLKIQDDNSKPMFDRRLQQLPTVKQSEKGGSKLSYSDLIAKRDSGTLDMYSQLLLAMYTYLYPVRADYFATQIIYNNETPTSPNYIRMTDSSAELMLTEFKTAKQFKQIHYPTVPHDLFLLLQQSLKNTPRQYLFVGNNSKPFTRVRYSQWAAELLEKTMGVELNLTIVRHLFISTISMELPAHELKRIGDLMGHSFAQQKLYKWHPTSEASS